jgi:hypothetical protein
MLNPLMCRFKSVFDATKVIARGCVVSVAALAAMAPSWGANADVTVQVSAVPATVSVSRTDLTNFGAIQVTVTPLQNNVINRLVFTSSAKVVLTEGSPPTTTPATFKESIPAGACVPSGNAVTCSADQARGSDGPLSYVLIYESPLAGLRLQYDWTFTYSRAGSPGSASSSIPVSGQALATLSETDSPQQRKELNTFVPSTGGTFRTGDGSATSTGDPSTTKLIIPPALGLREAVKILEDDGVAGGLTNDTSTTNTTTTTVPFSGLFSVPVTIVLQRDGSTINAKSQNAADRVPIYYTSTSGETWQVVNFLLPNCSDVAGPSAVYPVCVDQRIYVKNNMLGAPKPGGGAYGPLDLNDFLFVLKALQNGRINW